jgi:dTDP-4-dehydrorhamnose 3,5-epimerase
MKLCKKKLFGSKIYKEIIYKDNRGFLINIDHKSKLLNLKFNREIITFSKKSTLRGMHYKLKSKEAKLMTVIKGRVFEVVIDLDKNSKTFKKHFSCYLGHKNYNQIYLPKNVAHGYYVLSDEAIIHYAICGNYEPQYETGLKWDDTSLNIKWPKGNKILSKKDKNFS